IKSPPHFLNIPLSVIVVAHFAFAVAFLLLLHRIKKSSPLVTMKTLSNASKGPTSKVNGPAHLAARVPAVLWLIYCFACATFRPIVHGLLFVCMLVVACLFAAFVKQALVVAALAAFLWMSYYLVSPKNLEWAVTRWWLEACDWHRPVIKSGSVFAATRGDQELLTAIQGYLDQPTMARPLVGEIPLKLSGSVERGVCRHVYNRESEDRRTSLLCNCGYIGSGRTTLLQLTTVEAVRTLKTMVGEHVTPKEAQGKYRPLGFYVTFKDGPTPICADRAYLEAKTFPILTAIALRMAYSVVVPPKSDDVDHSKNSVDYRKFSRIIASQCDMTSDKDNFDRIIGALRRVLQWEGPMFIAIDEFKVPFAFRTPQECNDGLEKVCKHVLDDALPILKTPTVTHTVYASYFAVSLLDTIRFSMYSNRRLIGQAMPIIGVRDVAQLVNVGKVEPHREILGKRTKLGPLRPHQLLFLLHMALSTGTPEIMNDCVRGHARYKISEEDASPAQCFHPDSRMLPYMFWSRTHAQIPQKKDVTEEECICAAHLVAGSLAADIFDNRTSEDYRVLALDPELAASCTVIDVASTPRDNAASSEGCDESATRLFVSPLFLWSVLCCWPATGCSSIRVHVHALADTLTYHARLTTALVRVGETLVAHGGKEDPSHLLVCDQLIAKWMEVTNVGICELTFDALCLRLSCDFENPKEQAKSVKDILSRVCSNVADTIEAEVLGGRLERVDISNFPSFFIDGCAPIGELNGDDAVCMALEDALTAAKNALGDQYDEMSSAVDRLTLKHPRTTIPPSPGDTSHIRLQSALAKGHHFCFQPSNPNNQGEDGVVFLRNKGDDAQHSDDGREWTVLLLQCKFWLRDIVKEVPVIAKCRDSIAHLPATVVDADGKEHTLHYVRILV
ncbi:multi-copy leucine-rich repeat protein, putative, partial [Bodo saltans]